MREKSELKPFDHQSTTTASAMAGNQHDQLSYEAASLANDTHYDNTSGSVRSGQFDHETTDGRTIFVGDAGTINGATDALDTGGNDRIIGTSQAETIAGDAETIFDGHGGDDIIIGHGGGDTVYGDSVSMFGTSSGGDDVITLNDHDSPVLVYGDAALAFGTLTGGDDTITDGNGSSTIYGDFGTGEFDDGNDIIFGGGGNDQIIGGGGDDILNGGSGADKLTGGSGQDAFVIETGTGYDLISDFTTGDDILDISDFGLTFADLDTTSDNVIDGSDQFCTMDENTLIIDLGEASGGAVNTDYIQLTNVDQLVISDLGTA